MYVSYNVYFTLISLFVLNQTYVKRDRKKYDVHIRYMISISLQL